jgi:hypothetical protein
MKGGFNEVPGKIWRQGLFEESSTQKHRIGAMRLLDDGRLFVYSKAGAALAAGECNQAAATDAYSLECAVAVAAAVDDQSITITYGAGTTATANYYRDGFAASVMPAYGIGNTYKINKHAAAVSGGSLSIHLYDKLLVALTVSSKITLVKHPQDGVIQSIITTPTGVITGVSPIAVTSAYYFWNQVRGTAQVLGNGNWVVGDHLVPGGVAGALMPMGAVTDPIVAYCLKDSTDTYGGFAMLAIPGY